MQKGGGKGWDNLAGVILSGRAEGPWQGNALGMGVSLPQCWGQDGHVRDSGCARTGRGGR